MNWAGVLAGVVAATALAPAASPVVGTAAPPPKPEPSTDNDHLFTVGDIHIPQGGEPGEVSLVIGNPIGEGHLLLILRNNGDRPVYEINVLLTGRDSSGEDVTAEFFIPTAGLAPGEWIFGSNAIDAPGLDDLAEGQLRFDASEQPGSFVALDVTSAELRGDHIVGSVTNSGEVPVGNFNVVSVACFNESQPTDFTTTMLDVQSLRSGESADFTTDVPVDPAACASFAMYAVGLPMPLGRFR
jgi:hypothetical protein